MKRTEFFATMLAVVREMKTVRVDGDGWDKMSSCVRTLEALVEGGIEDEDRNEQGQDLSGSLDRHADQ